MPRAATGSAPSCPRATPARRRADAEAADRLGRHGHRPAHIHFFVTAPGYRKLTTQINIDGDEYLHDDFAFATRDGLIPTVGAQTDPAAIHAHGLNAPFAEITFDFVLHAESAAAPRHGREREHAPAG